jgi:hypothetical protein
MEKCENIKIKINAQENEILLIQQQINGIQIEIMNKGSELEELQLKINKTQEVKKLNYTFMIFFLSRSKMILICIIKK